jgi:hypothetical protein
MIEDRIVAGMLSSEPEAARKVGVGWVSDLERRSSDGTEMARCEPLSSKQGKEFKLSDRSA